MDINNSNSLLDTKPPFITYDDVIRVIDVCYPGFTKIKPLSGERDLNFKITNDKNTSLTLKFINAAESIDETQMQVDVLKHISNIDYLSIPKNQAVKISSINSTNDFTAGPNEQTDFTYWFYYNNSKLNKPIRIRAYSFIDGKDGLHLQLNNKAWENLGKTIAKLDKQLVSFDHISAHRKLLWDTTQILGLKHMINAVEDSRLKDSIYEYLDIFSSKILLHLKQLPWQVIHNDLSPSNFLVDETGEKIIGILDFGDMVWAPRIAEIAVASSYQMAFASDPMVALNSIIKGFELITNLSEYEHNHVIDLVLARFVQRIVITAWRAEKFPLNKEYILRSQPMAVRLFNDLYIPWKKSNTKQYA